MHVGGIAETLFESTEGGAQFYESGIRASTVEPLYNGQP